MHFILTLFSYFQFAIALGIGWYQTDELEVQTPRANNPVVRDHSTTVSANATPSTYGTAQQTPSLQKPGTGDTASPPPSIIQGHSTEQAEPSTTEQVPSALTFQHSSSPADAAAFPEQNTATQRARPDPSTLLNYGPTSASRVLADLAPTELVVSATDTSGLVPTAQSSFEALQHQNEDGSSLSPLAYSTDDTGVVLGQASATPYPVSMSGNNNLRPEQTPGADIRPTSAPVGDQFSNNGVENLASVVGQVAATTQQPAPTGEPNALSVLFSALPTGIVQSIASEYLPSGILDPIESFLSTPASEPTQRPSTIMTSRPPEPESSTFRTMRPTSLPPQHPPSRPTPSTSSALSSSTSIVFTSLIPSTLSTMARVSSTSSSAFSATSTAALTSDSAPAPTLANASIAGIATGVAAGAVVVALGAFVLFQRKRQGKAPFAREPSQRSGRAYPEVAWLYDPAPSPPPEGEAHDKNASERALLSPHGGAHEMASMASAPGTPELRPARPESPLLPPVMPAARGLSPARGASPGGSPSHSARSSIGSSSGGRRSGRSSAGSVGRMIPISEEERV